MLYKRDLLNRALDSLEAEEVTTKAISDWLLRNKEAINRSLDESFAAKERRESYSAEEAEVILAERWAARVRQVA